MPDVALPHASTSPLTRRLTSALAAAARVLRVVIGAPDYEAYLAHHARRCAGHPPLTREQFADARQRARYERPGSRCC